MFFNHVELHKYDLTNAGISQACYDELVASGNNSSEEQLRVLADHMREEFKDYMRPLFHQGAVVERPVARPSGAGGGL